jgi:hypothetical protein
MGTSASRFRKVVVKMRLARYGRAVEVELLVIDGPHLLALSPI